MDNLINSSASNTWLQPTLILQVLSPLENNQRGRTHLLLPTEASKWNILCFLSCSSYFKSAPFITWRKCFLPKDAPQRTKIQAAPLPIQLQPSKLCDFKLMLDVTQKGLEPWFRAPGHFQRCSKSRCWTKPASRNGPWGISQSFQVEFTRTCWPPPLKRKEQNEPTKEVQETFLLMKTLFL